MHTTAWLFDLYPLGDRIVLWFLTGQGQPLRLEDDFPYRLYLGGPKERLRGLAQNLGRRGWLRRAFFTTGRELVTGDDIPVLALELKAYAYLSPLRGILGKLEDQFQIYNADLDLAAYYLYVRGLHPCLWYDLDHADGRLRAAAPLEDAFAPEFALPPFTTLHLGLARDPLIPLSRGNVLTLTWEGRTLEVEAASPQDLVRQVARVLKDLNPDLILSDWGDEDILPALLSLSRRHRLALPLDRETGPAPRKAATGRSYFSYGRIVYQGPSLPLFGRWHVDRKNSFFYREAGLRGLAQIARIGQLPLQQAARTSPGTLITSMQLARAVADNILIPWRKADPERFKSAGELLTIDKGGLSFMPPIGVHADVAELDFASMYPTIMTIHNISPETVNCACCVGNVGEGAKGRSPLPPPPHPLPQSLNAFWNDAVRANALSAPAPVKGVGEGGVGGGRGNEFPRPSPHDTVPEAGFRLCRRREGLVPRTLRPILILREQLKARAKETVGEEAQGYRERQNALKWMLVTCFGYLGYKNARFGRIEAHEAVTAFGRDKLLTAKEICEEAGYEVLHGLTDCLWLAKPGMTTEELEDLCREVSRVTGVRLALEGRYRWIAFLPSRQNRERPVATRYFGVFADGSLKVRGLACRRRDTPPLVRRAQQALLDILAGAAAREDLPGLRQQLHEAAEGFRRLLQEGGLDPRDLVITRVLSQPVAEYRVDTPTALAARQLAGAGIEVVPGEKVRYVHRERRGPKECRIQAAPFLDSLESYDTRTYLELLNRAVEEVMEGVYGVEGGGQGAQPPAPSLKLPPPTP